MEKQHLTCESNKLPECYRNSYNSFDVAKLICSILVVMIHIAPLGEQSNNIYSYINFGLQQCLCRIAVPLFFMFNGFFLYKKNDLNNYSFKHCKSYVLRIARLYFLWVLIYLPTHIIDMLRNSKGFLYGVAVYIKRMVFLGGYNHLWYLNALLTAVIIISFLLHKKCTPEKILCISFVFYVFGLLGDGYYGLISPLQDIPYLAIILKVYFKLFGTTRNGLFFAFFFVALGMFFANKDILIEKKKSFLFFIISVILLCAEVYVLQIFDIPKDHNILIFIVPSAIFCFLFLSNIKLKDNVVYTYIRKLSSLIFYLHPWILFIYLESSEIFNININNTPFPFLIVLTLTVLLSMILIKLSRKYKWIKNFFNA